ncbi:hypothetical protein SPRG_08046 [Saprolegnia parasitica CBS 223.65]|uniref:HSF-type DNA-binding domain-containing protein n=1 Tax=Saprolegnia parasitica (strain CBS 223.65) TaxID=695850 RepID=A0A067CIM4_SAPPC|nr:hypothetical protein SPRG_08046 [Saprolegnia parasitica CBS 223.65]KDO26642.1 hypothetical protein SPRG_08046 [Saprolegnia parasitica CBS 223.65]|eukprot:XP_012202781.1 hypothetical protein SPRG_08046 [Saprolegnia parasitica CBS 223.65]
MDRHILSESTPSPPHAPRLAPPMLLPEKPRVMPYRQPTEEKWVEASSDDEDQGQPSTTTTTETPGHSKNPVEADGEDKERMMSKTVPFLEKTYMMLEQCTPSVASWAPDGLSFVVYNADKFASEVIPMYFKHSKFSSFVRQLNFYGFRRLKSRGKPHFNGDQMIYHQFRHPKFVRGRPELFHSIQRKRHGQNMTMIDPPPPPTGHAIHPHHHPHAHSAPPAYAHHSMHHPVHGAPPAPVVLPPVDPFCKEETLQMLCVNVRHLTSVVQIMSEELRETKWTIRSLQDTIARHEHTIASYESSMNPPSANAHIVYRR